jgi:uncharacterized membrane protein (DUF2068 family)
MSGVTAVRVAALVAIGYGLWVLVGGPVRFGAGADALSVRMSLGNPIAWLVGLLAIVIGWGLWVRYAWAWWLGLAAALFQTWRIVYPIFSRPGAPRLPGAETLIVLAMLLVFVLLLFMPKARATCNR